MKKEYPDFDKLLENYRIIIILMLYMKSVDKTKYGKLKLKL